MKRLLPVFLVFAILFAVPGQAAYAAEGRMPPSNRTLAGGVPSCWTRQFQHTVYRTADMGETLEESIYVTVRTDFTRPDGYPVFARGDLSWAGTAYDFPQAGRKQATYKGIVTAYIDG